MASVTSLPASAARARAPLHPLFAIAAAWIAAALVHGRALATWFTPDDVVSLARAAGLEPTPLTFRPLSAVLAFRIEHALFGLDPLGYHAVNFALHLLNAAGVYALALRLSGRGGVAGAAAFLFAISTIAFTPLHWASGIGDLLACGLLLAGTLLHLEGRERGAAWPWAAAAVAFAAVLAKESAVAWPAAIAVLELASPARSGGTPASLTRRLVPAAVTAGAMLAWLALSRGVPRPAPGDPYALSDAPGHLAGNLLTYLGWIVSIGDPIPDAIAAVDRSVWLAGLLVIAIVLAGLRFGSPRERPAILFGAAWLLVFLVPVLPLAHHTYLYYLYVPWAGGAAAAAALGAELIPARSSPLVAVLALAALGALEGRSVSLREHATWDALPADRTVREASLLAHAVPALHAAALPAGTRVGFVNPAPGPSLDLMTGRPTQAADRARRLSYYPLEAAMLGGKTLRVFLPGLVYAGFARTIPPGWDDVEWFLFEQRGYLRRWGRGAEARRREAEYLASLSRP